MVASPSRAFAEWPWHLALGHDGGECLVCNVWGGLFELIDDMLCVRVAEWPWHLA